MTTLNRESHLEDCIERCRENPQCNYFTIEKQDDHCVLYEDCGDTVRCDTCASGAKYCSRGYQGETKLAKSTRANSKSAVEAHLDEICGSLNGDVIQIFVKMFDTKFYTLNLEPSSTILCVKAKLYVEDNYIVEDMMLVFHGKELRDDSTTLSDNNIKNKSTLYLMFRREPFKRPKNPSQCEFPAAKDQRITARVLGPVIGYICRLM